MTETEAKVEKDEKMDEHVHDHNCSHGHNHHHHTVGQTITNANKVGRNDPCHCGSGKKFKKCCYA